MLHSKEESMRRALKSLSLRGRVFAALLALQFLPVLVVALATWVLRDQHTRTQHAVAATLRRALTVLNTPFSAPQDQRLVNLNEVARAHKSRITIIDTRSTLYTTPNYHVHSNLGQLVTDLFDPRIADELKALDETLPPLWQRPEVTSSFAAGTHSECFIRSIGMPPLPLVGHCIAMSRQDTESGPRWIVVEDVYRRNFRVLHDVRRQAAQLALGVLLLVVIPSGLFLSWQLARPIHHLSAQCRVRASGNNALTHVNALGYPEIEELAGSFNHLLSTLAERNQQNEAFVADVAHELKSPIAALRACAERLQQPEPIEPTRLLRMAEIMITSCGRMDAMVSQFLDLTRVDAGLPTEERVLFFLDELVRRILDDVQVNPRFESVRFVATMDPAPIRGVPGRIESAVGNLLSNAATFALRSSTERQVRVAVLTVGDSIQLLVEDSGPGIRAEHMAHLFRRFFTTEPQGTGLGLAMTRAIFEAHGGSVTAASATIGGARFTAVIPSMEAAST